MLTLVPMVGEKTFMSAPPMTTAKASMTPLFVKSTGMPIAGGCELRFVMKTGLLRSSVSVLAVSIGKRYGLVAVLLEA